MGKADCERRQMIAAIDAGSNGFRLAIGRVNGNGIIHDVENRRESVRLGADAFSRGEFSEETLTVAVKAFERFAERIKLHEVQAVRAVATSAAREAANGRQLAARVRKATGIRLEIIDGLEEAKLVLDGVAGNVDISSGTAMLVDIGGGSVEVTVARNGLALGCETFPLGPVRLLERIRAKGLKESDAETLVEEVRGSVADLLEAEIDGETPDICVGTGGNVECLGRLRVPLLGKEKTGKVKFADLSPMIRTLLDMTPAQRAAKLDLRQDRADVIAIAAIVVRAIMADAGVSRMLTPGVGLSQGLLRRVAQTVGSVE
jgi:exopolyphosphatase/guanosine-5'-triphosphate,3'-diphosphate pyrophosphatase